MICYKDKTFCDYYGCKHFSECPRTYTDEEENKNIHNLPVSLFAELPNCYERQDEQ